MKRFIVLFMAVGFLFVCELGARAESAGGTPKTTLVAPWTVVVHASGDDTGVTDLENLRQALDVVAVGGTIRFAPGTYYLMDEVPGGAALEITKSVTLEALYTNQRPVLNIANTAFNGAFTPDPDPYTYDQQLGEMLMTEAVTVDVNGRFACRYLIINHNSNFHIIRVNGSVFYRCDVVLTSDDNPEALEDQSHPYGFGLHYGTEWADTTTEPVAISGEHRISYSVIDGNVGGLEIFAESHPDLDNYGYTDFGNSHFIVEYSTLRADASGFGGVVLNSGWGLSASDLDTMYRPLMGTYDIRRNTISGGNPVWVLFLFGGNLTVSDNDITSTGQAWYTYSFGIFSFGHTDTSYTVIRNNRIHVNSPIEAYYVAGIYLGGNSRYFGIWNTQVLGNVVDGTCHMDAGIWLYNAENCRVGRNRLSGWATTGINFASDYSFDNVIINNDLTGMMTETSQLYLGAGSEGTKIYGNRFGSLAMTSDPSGGEPVMPAAVVQIDGSENDCWFNDYRQSRLYDENGDLVGVVPGWTEGSPDGPGCILLGGSGNMVYQKNNFPLNTWLCEQVLDLGTDNEVAGYHQWCEN